MAYEFVEAFSSVVPRVRISKILAALSVFVDLVWRIATRSFLQPSFIDIPAALLIGFYLEGVLPLQSRIRPRSQSGSGFPSCYGEIPLIT